MRYGLGMMGVSMLLGSSLAIFPWSARGPYYVWSMRSMMIELCQVCWRVSCLSSNSLVDSFPYSMGSATSRGFSRRQGAAGRYGDWLPRSLAVLQILKHLQLFLHLNSYLTL